MTDNKVEENSTKLYVEKIREGTVIDHIKKGHALAVLKILKLEGKDGRLITIGINVGRGDHLKDIIKVANVYLEEKQLNQIALISPDSKVSYIENYSVKEKIIVKIPMIIKGIVKCPNDRCITNKEREPVTNEFKVLNSNPLKIACGYCERILLRPEILENLL